MSVFAQEVPTAQLEFFEKQVRPLLVKHCYECHSHQADNPKAGLLLDSRAGMLRGGDSGPAIAPNDSQASLLVSSIRYESFEMPPKGKLTEAEVQALVTWVDRGAWWPEEAEPTIDKGKPAFDLQSRKASHWVWQPIAAPQTPAVSNADWVKNAVDAFILSKLEAAGLAPAPAIDRRGLLRRLYFDLIGLPPTPEQAASFLRDTSTTAIETLVDQLLDSPHFGERWGRHWLDLVRYAESRGHEFDSDANNAYQYRDYVIRALNADVPYDQFVREHIAGDLLIKPRMNPELGFNESILGTGFWFFGEWVHSPVDIRKDETDRFDNMIDVMSKTFLGVTIACARCHDHKFDAISSRDYYALSGFLQSSDFRQVRFETLERERATAAELDRIDRKYRRRLRTELASYLDRIVDQDSRRSATSPDTSQASATEVGPTYPMRTLVDYRQIESQEYLQDGFIFGTGPTLAGEPTLAEVNGEPKLVLAGSSSARNDIFWYGLTNQTETLTQSNSGLDFLLRSGRTLRTPTVALQTGAVHIQLRGGGLVVACVDSHRQIGGPLHKETILKIKSEAVNASEPDSASVRWYAMDLARYRGHRVHFEFTPDEETTLEVLKVVEAESAEAGNAAPTESAGPADEHRPAHSATARDALNAWRLGTLDNDLRSMELISILNRLIVEHLHAGGASDADAQRCQSTIADWIDERASLEQASLRSSQLAMAMLDGSGEDDHVLIRGSSANPGEVVRRRFLEAIDGDQPLSLKTRSGRLELADRINEPSNPLTSRVIVNRIWHHLFGRGLVPTTDDFGVLGQMPTHPELLDYLASEFRRDGQSMKRMIRRLALSQAYQMSSDILPAAVQQDPKNLLWHHVPPKRLEGEAIRDSLLMLAGNLKPERYGPSIPIHLTDFMDGRGRPKKNGPSDGAGRRSIYIAVRRNFLSPFMLAFDTPAPFSTMGRRNVSNVPAQALILMNDPFVAKQASGLAKRIIAEASEAPELRIRWLYEVVFARPPQPQELSLMLEFAQQQADERKVPIVDLAIWTDVAHALINTKEFVFLR